MGTTEDTVFVRERLIQGALSLIAREGCGSLGVRRLAQAAERSSMCVYTSFGSRSGLLTAAYERVSRELITATAAGARSDEVSSAYQRWARENPRLYAFLFDHPLDTLDVDPALRRKLLDDLLDILGTDHGGAQVDAEWASLHGAISIDRIRDTVQP